MNEVGASGLGVCAKPEKIKTTLINVEEIDNGYLVSPANNYVNGFKKVYIQDLSTLPEELAKMFNPNNDME